MEYDVGDLVRVTATFGEGAVDPTEVVAKVRQPSGTVTTLTYGVDAALVRASTGTYHVDVDLTAAGTWRIRFESRGTGQAAEDRVLLARAARVS